MPGKSKEKRLCSSSYKRQLINQIEDCPTTSNIGKFDEAAQKYVSEISSNSRSMKGNQSTHLLGAKIAASKVGTL